MGRSPGNARFARRTLGRLWRPVAAASLLSSGASAALGSLAAPAAQAATFTVTTTADSGAGSLRQALAAASSGDTITFATGLSGTIELASILDISTNVTISGPGASIIAVSGQDSSGVFFVSPAVNVTISGIAIENGNALAGGGIDNLGTLTATQDVFSDDTAIVGGAIADCGEITGPIHPASAGCGGAGGAISNGPSSPVVPTTTVSYDSFVDNSASENGGAIYSVDASANALTASDDLFSGNTAGNWGGAIMNCASLCGIEPGPFEPGQGSASPEDSLSGTATITNSTFWDNIAFSSTGGGIYDEGVATTVTNATFAQNSPDAVANGEVTTETTLLGSILAESLSPKSDCDGTGIIDGGYNIDDDGSCQFSAANHSLSDQSDSAIFGPSPAPQLASNGGPTQTVAIPGVSVAAGLEATGCPPTDQRGISRPATNCTAGAYQISGLPGPGVAPSAPLDLVGTDGQITLTWEAPLSSGTAPVTSYEVFRFTASSAASQIATVLAPADTYVDTDVTPGVTYSYYVEATNIFGNSPPSNVVSVTAPEGPTTSSGACGSYTGNAAFVCALYEDILGRAPDSAGLGSWLAAMSSGTSTTQVAYGIANSAEFATDYIESDYEAFLGRPADPGGLATFLQAFSAGASPDQIDASILGSAEFFTDSGSSNSGFVDAVYEDLLGRAADPGGLASWTTALADGESRTQVAYAIDTSNEHDVDSVQFLYQLLLGRAADPGGLATWVGALQSGATLQQVIAGIAGSQEFYYDSTGA